MREHKYRAWDGKGFYYFEVGSEQVVGADDILEQYTGLKDKNGKEIYEGDILNPEENDDAYLYSTVIFKHGCFGYMASDGDFIPLGRNQYYFDIRGGAHQSHKLLIIGNIRENPELIV